MKLLTLLFTLLCSMQLFANQLVPADLILLYNSAEASSKELAHYYALKRGVPERNIVGFEMPTEPKISRQQFNTLRTQLVKELVRLPGSKRVLVCFRGVPYGINRDGKEQNEASLDSELTAPNGLILKKWLNNPYYKKDTNLSLFQMLFEGSSRIMPVARIDGPSVEHCKRMIDDAIAIEKTGLWGVTYLDKAFKGKNYQAGDTSLIKIEELNWANGIPTITENTKLTYGSQYPMESAACYFGWYTGTVNGPFKDENFKFKRGAVAAHLHSFSASHLRSSKSHWVGPLIDRGACVVLGNVYEPYLQGTTQFDLFYKRLIDGYTVVESAYMATPFLSWQTVVIGDPLYRPFKHLEKVSGDQTEADKPFRIMNIHWKLEPVDESKRLSKIRTSAARTSDYRLFEYLGLWQAYKGESRKAAQFFRATEHMNPHDAGAVRNLLHRSALYQNINRRSVAIQLLEEGQKLHADSSYLGEINSRLLQLKGTSKK